MEKIVRVKLMRSFNYSKIKYSQWDSEVLGLVSSIYRYHGKQEFYLKQRPEELNKLIEIAKIQSTEASNEIEGIITTRARLKKIVEEKLPAVDLVRKAILHKFGRFTKQDIREFCLSLSLSSIEGSLRKLVAEGEIKREGVGRAIKYIICNS